MPPQEEILQSLAEIRRADLLGVSRADGRDAVGVADSPGEIVDALSVVPQKLIARRGHAVQTENVAEDVGAILPLEFEIVDREHGADVAVAGGVAVLLAQKHRRERRVPVVAVEDIREKVRQIPAAFADGLGEERHALAVVKVAVSAVAPEVIFVIEEIPSDAAAPQLEEPAVLAAPAERDIERRGTSSSSDTRRGSAGASAARRASRSSGTAPRRGETPPRRRDRRSS